MSLTEIIRKRIIAFFILLTFLIISLIWHITSVSEFNDAIHVWGSDQEKGDVYFDLTNRDLATSSWIKRDYNLYGDTVDLTAITFDGTLYNNSKYLLDNWTLRIGIKNDCFINQMWNGTLEIHQFNSTDTNTVDTINLASYNLDDIKFKYLYDGDLLIPLSKSDYIIYYPSPKFKETSIESNSDITIGGIFYFLDNIDLSNYSLEYHYHKSYFEGISFYVTLFASILFILFIFYIIVEFSTYQRFKREMELKNRMEHAEREAKEKSSFLANMSHEIRTPINTIIGLDTMILRENKDSETRKYAKEIKNASSLLLSLINGVLDSSKMEAGKMELIPASYSFKQLLFDIRSLTKTAIEAKNINYVFDISPSIPEKLFGDDVRLRQIIINLLTNATKYTEKGTITFSVKDVIENNKVKLTFSVKDTGMGIKEEDIKKLAESYQRVNGDKTRVIEGTGLGLRLVKGILKLMDSKLEVKSTYGEGSNFYFTIYQDIENENPIGDIDFNNMEIDDDEEYVSSFIASSAKILVVDDNPMNLMVFEKLLKDTKVQVTKASSGYEALDLTMKDQYDIIFMDHMMPEMDGIETFKNIRKQENGLNKNTVVIVLTANALTGAKEEYLQIGFNDFIQKPIEPEILEASIKYYLPKEKIEKEFVKKDNESNSEKEIDLSKMQIEGVDLSYGIDHCEDSNGLISVMKNFMLMATEDANDLLDYYNHLALDNNDFSALDSYRIKVHAMKTSAGMIGALQVYGAAAFLEKAAREKHVKEIIVATPFFLEFWNQLKTNVDNFIYTLSDNDNKSKKEVNKDNLKNLLHHLNTAMQTFDIKNADEIMKEIDNYNLKDKEETLRELKIAVSKLEADKIENLCNELLK